MTHLILPDSPSSVLQLLNADKKALQLFASVIINDVEDGKENPLEIHVLLKKYEYVMDAIKAGIKDNVSREAAKYGDKEFEYGGAKCHYTATATSYDFSVCNDAKLNEMERQAEILKNEIEARKTFLKGIKEPLMIVNDDGEVIPVYPANKKQSMGLKISIK